MLLVHAAITGAAGFALIVRPEIIPGAVGIRLAPDAYLLTYLLAAAEFGFAALSAFGASLSDPRALRAILVSVSVLHAVSALLEARVWLTNAAPILVANIAARILIIAVFLWLLPRSAEWGRLESLPYSER